MGYYLLSVAETEQFERGVQVQRRRQLDIVTKKKGEMLVKENDSKKITTESNQRWFYNDINVYVESNPLQPAHHFCVGSEGQVSCQVDVMRKEFEDIEKIKNISGMTLIKAELYL